MSAVSIQILKFMPRSLADLKPPVSLSKGNLRSVALDLEEVCCIMGRLES